MMPAIIGAGIKSGSELWPVFLDSANTRPTIQKPYRSSFAWNGTAYIIAASSGTQASAAFYSTTDFVNFAQISGTPPNQTQTNGSKLIYLNNLYFYFPRPGYLYVSSDLINWTYITNQFVFLNVLSDGYIYGTLQTNNSNLIRINNQTGFETLGNFSANKYSIEYANEKYVVGSNSGIYVSSNLTNWVQTSNNVSYSVVYFKNKFISIGKIVSASTSFYICESVDAINWIQIEPTGLQNVGASTQNIAIAKNNSFLILQLNSDSGGANPLKSYSSLDGKNWYSMFVFPNFQASVGTYYNGYFYPKAINFNRENILIGTEQNPSNNYAKYFAITKSSFIKKKNCAFRPSNTFDNCTPYSIDWVKDRFYISGSFSTNPAQKKWLESTDGETWTLVTNENLPTAPYYGKTYLNGVYVIRSVTGIFYSTDDQNWILAYPYTGGTSHGTNDFRIINVNQRLFALGSGVLSFQTVTSEDGINWIPILATSPYYSEQPASMRSIVYFKGAYYGITSYLSTEGTALRVFKSLDGINWVQETQLSVTVTGLAATSQIMVALVSNTAAQNYKTFDGEIWNAASIWAENALGASSFCNFIALNEYFYGTSITGSSLAISELGDTFSVIPETFAITPMCSNGQITIASEKNRPTTLVYVAK